jgi:hypothetical protein
MLSLPSWIVCLGALAHAPASDQQTNGQQNGSVLPDLLFMSCAKRVTNFLVWSVFQRHVAIAVIRD